MKVHLQNTRNMRAHQCLCVEGKRPRAARSTDNELQSRLVASINSHLQPFSVYIPSSRRMFLSPLTSCWRSQVGETRADTIFPVYTTVCLWCCIGYRTSLSLKYMYWLWQRSLIGRAGSLMRLIALWYQSFAKWPAWHSTAVYAHAHATGEAFTVSF